MSHRSPLELAAVEWARLDRAADDRAADLQGIERAIANSDRPIPRELLAARALAGDALRIACQEEGHAVERLHAIAKQILDQSCEGRKARS